MAFITGKVPGSCVDNIENYADRIECTPKVNAAVLSRGLTNGHHEFRCLAVGTAGEEVHIVVHWPEYDVDSADRSNEYWFVESFYGVADQVVFTGTDELHWQRIETVWKDGWDLHIKVTLPEEGHLYVSVNLPFTVKALQQVCDRFAPWRVTVGKTAGGMDIPAFRFGTGKKVIWLQANQHVTEVCGCHVLASLMEYISDPAVDLKDYTFVVIPSVSVEKMFMDQEYPEYPVNINRDWGTRKQPETKAIHDYLQGMAAEGYEILVMVDMHCGWCRVGDSGGNITEYNHGFIPNDYWERRMRYTHALLSALDYEKPDKIWWCDFPPVQTFFQYGSQLYGALCSTYEFSRFQIWNREKGDYDPLSQEALEKLGKQYAKFLLSYDFEEV